MIRKTLHEIKSCYSSEGGFWAEVPAIQGCATQGETIEELLTNLYEAVEACLFVFPSLKNKVVSYLGREDWDHSECGFMIFNLKYNKMRKYKGDDPSSDEPDPVPEAPKPR